MTEQAGTQKKYHKGNVRADLLATALKMLVTEGIADLSLNRIAKAVGVSTPAVYNHFSGKEALLAAVAAEGFRMLTETQRSIMDDETIAQKPFPLALAYLKFASDEPNLYRLMFRHEIANRHDYPELIAAEDETFALSARLYNLEHDPSLRAQDYPEAFMRWATLHGLATLIADNHVQAKTEADLTDLAWMAVKVHP